MSKSKLGLRQAGTAGAVVALTVGVAGLTAGSASAAAGDFAASAHPAIAKGATAPGGALTYEFNGTFNTNSTVTFTVADSDGNGCTTGGQNGVSFTAATATVAATATGTHTGAVPTAAAGAPTSSSAACNTVGVTDVVTVSLDAGLPSSATGEYVLTVTPTYKVGTSATPGAVNVGATSVGTGAPVPASVSDATIQGGSVAYSPRTGSITGSSNNALGTLTYKDTGGSYFPASANTLVTLTLSDGVFTNGATPTISVPSGYTVNKDNAATPTAGTPAEDGTGTYTFYVKAPADVSAPATITVSGLKTDAGGSPAAVTLTSVVNGSTSVVDAASNQVDTERAGGANRYATAAAVYDQGGFNTSSVVLAGGQQFPDALSANYLASKTDGGIGTLLTPSNSLSQDALREIIDNGTSTVYITGGTAAVSQAVQDQIASHHVGDAPFQPLIQVIRISGANRYATNSAINLYQRTDSPTVIVAGGKLPYDSLAVGPVVYKQKDALVLTDGQNFTSDEASQLDNLGATNVVIVGGTAAVSTAVESQIKGLGYTVSRVSGANRGATAAQVATWGTQGLKDSTGAPVAGILGTPQGLTSDTTDLTNGTGFADALSDGPVAGSLNEPILLAQDANTVGAGLATYLNGKTVGTAGTTTVSDLKALGLTGATSNALIRSAAAEIGVQPPKVTTTP